MAEIEILSGITAGLVVKVVSLLSEEVIWAWKLVKDLKKLRTKLDYSVALLNDATSTAQLWFEQLEGAVADAGAFLDELAYQVAQENVENHPIHRFIPSIKTFVYHSKIKSIRASFEYTFKLAGELGLNPVQPLNSDVQPRDIRVKSLYEDTSLVVGRDEDISNMPEAFGADLAARLVAKLVSLAAKQVIQAWNLDKYLQKLGDRFEIIGALLDAARAKKISIVEKWFNKLEDVANDTEVFLDELEYKVTRKIVKYHGKQLRSFISSKSPLYRYKMAVRINSIHASFDEIFKWGKEIGLDAVAHLNTTVQPRVIRCEPPFEDKALIVGRDKDISNLVHIVCMNNERDLPVVAIVGMGGQGKTTLARMVLDNAYVIKIFTKRMWITVSDDFNLIKILNQMVQSLTSINLALDNVQGLINELQTSLKGEKFLLVLDDVWNEESKEWEDLKNSLLGVGGDKGSSVVVTTRKLGVIDAMQNCVPYPVESLQEEDSYELFKKIAFQDGVLETDEFVALGRRMVERCGGLPLAIKALGGMLRSKKSGQEWQMIQNSEIWTSQDVLRLSYDNLPYSSLKRCFVHCSIIPKDSQIDKDELIQIWMALGFLLPPPGSDALMEDIGSEYFNILLSYSLLQDIERDEFGNIKSCKMHDLVHDLALDLFKHEQNHVFNATYLWLDNRVSDWNPTILKTNFEKVRFLNANVCIFGEVLACIKHLTVLVLNTDVSSDWKARELPKSFQRMKYIKHLDISCLRSKLPSYITELYNLQTLRVWDLEELPENFCNLINLRHLYIKNPNGNKCLLNGIERLTCLQTLPHFVVSKDQNCLIGQLEGLQNLRGTVNLYGLRDVPDMEEARKATLCTKASIQSLLLNWEKFNDSEDEREREYNNECVMEGLEPHTNLKELIIQYFMGKRFALWITKMTNLVKITIRGSKRCEEFPSLGHLPNLREMEFNGMDDLRIIGSDIGLAKAIYPSLTKLILNHLPKLEEWVEADTSRVSVDGSSVQVFPKLEVLDIEGCPNLTRMPNSFFQSLKQLIIKGSSLTDLDISSEGGGRVPLMEELLKNNYQSLKSLKLFNCPGITSLTVGVALENLILINCPDLTSIKAVEEETCCLKHLVIRRCPSVSEIAQSVSSTIERLEIDEIPGALSSSVISFPNLTQLILRGFGIKKSTLEFDDGLISSFSALTRLNIFGFEGLKAIPDTVAQLPSLEVLIILGCKELESLPTFPQSHTIRRLGIDGCSKLKERCEKGVGPEWYKIQHIPTVSIS